MIEHTQASKYLTEAVNDFVNEITMVMVDRYSGNDADRLIGIHVVTRVMNGPDPMYFTHRVVGLFSSEEAAEISATFYHYYGSRFPILRGSLSFKKNQVDLQEFIRRQVIPLEWKGFSDDDLDGLIKTQQGFARRVELSSVSYTELTEENM